MVTLYLGCKNTNDHLIATNKEEQVYCHLVVSQISAAESYEGPLGVL